MPDNEAVAVFRAIANGTGSGIRVELEECSDLWLFGIDLDSWRDPSTVGKHPPAIELYTSNRYFAVTGIASRRRPPGCAPSRYDLHWLIGHAGSAFSGKIQRKRSAGNGAKGGYDNGDAPTIPARGAQQLRTAGRSASPYRIAE